MMESDLSLQRGRDQDDGGADGPEEGMSEEEFRRNLHAKLKSTGVLGTVKGQLRAQLLAQLQRNRVVDLSTPSQLQHSQQQSPDLRRRVLNTMLAEYLSSAHLEYSLSVFAEEAGANSLSSLTHEEIMGLLGIDEGSALQQALVRAKLARAGQPGACFLLQLLDAVGEVSSSGSGGGIGKDGGGGRGADALTANGDRYQMDVRLQQLESEYAARLRAERMRPVQGMEERMAMYRQEIEEQARADVQRQVERVRELEVAAARLDESTKWRRQLEKERQELERIHVDKMSKLRNREEETSDRLKRQQREVEAVAFEHRQRILREEDRVRTWCAEQQQLSSNRQDQLQHLERALELRERAVCSREASAESKGAQAAEAVAGAHLRARAEVEKEYLELKANLNAQRMQLEMERARVAEMRSEAAAQSGAARSKEDQVRVLEAARAEAEARAAGHAADAEVVRMHAERLQLELSKAREELSKRVAAAAGAADAMLENAAGALGILETEANATRGAGGQLRQTYEALQQEKENYRKEKEAREEAERDLEEAQAAADKAQQEVGTLTRRLERTESLVEEAIAARQQALQQAAHSDFQATQLQRELTEVRASLARARSDLAAQHAQLTQHQPQPQPYSSASPSPGLPSHSATVTPSQRPSRQIPGLQATHMLSYGSTLKPPPPTQSGGGGSAHTLSYGSTFKPPPSSQYGSGFAHIQSYGSTLKPPPLPPSHYGGGGGGGAPTPGVPMYASAPYEPWRAPGLNRAAPSSAASSMHASPARPSSGTFGAPATGAAGLSGLRQETSRPRSPVQERQDTVAKQQAEAAAQLSDYRKRLQVQQATNARDLALARAQALFSTSKPSSPTRPGADSRTQASPYSSPTKAHPPSSLLFPPSSPSSPPAPPLPVPLPSALQLELQPKLCELPIREGPPPSSLYPTSMSSSQGRPSWQQAADDAVPLPVSLPTSLQQLPSKHSTGFFPTSTRHATPPSASPPNAAMDSSPSSLSLGAATGLPPFSSSSTTQPRPATHLSYAAGNLFAPPTQPLPPASASFPPSVPSSSTSAPFSAPSAPLPSLSLTAQQSPTPPSATTPSLPSSGPPFPAQSMQQQQQPPSQSPPHTSPPLGPSISFGDVTLPAHPPHHVRPEHTPPQDVPTPLYGQPQTSLGLSMPTPPSKPAALASSSGQSLPLSSLPLPSSTLASPGPAQPPLQPQTGTAASSDPAHDQQPKTAAPPTHARLEFPEAAPAPEAMPTAPPVASQQPVQTTLGTSPASADSAAAVTAAQPPSIMPPASAGGPTGAAAGGAASADDAAAAAAPAAPPPGLLLVDTLPKPSSQPAHQQQQQQEQEHSQEQRNKEAGASREEGSGSGVAPAQPPLAIASPKPSTAEEVRQAQAAKLRMLQESLAVQRAQEEQQHEQAEREREERERKEGEERERRQEVQRHQGQEGHSSSGGGSGSSSSHMEQLPGMSTPPSSSKGSQMGESATPASAGGSASSEQRDGQGRQQQQQQQQPREQQRSARQTSSSNTQASSNEGPAGLEVPQNDSGSASRTSKARSRSQQESYSEDLDLPSGSPGLGSIESEANMVVGFDDESNSGSVF